MIENIKEKTIFDFCKDEKILRELVSMSKQDYLDNLKKNPINNAFDLLELADMTGNKELEKAVQSQYNKELKFYFNE